MKIGYYSTFCLILLYLFLNIGCSSNNKCSDYSSNGNAGNVINTIDDEYLPIIYNEKLYYTQVETKQKKNLPNTTVENTFFVNINQNGSFTSPQKEYTIPTNKINKAGSPTFYLDKENQLLEMYFAGQSQKNRLDKDIYTAYYTKDGWSDPISISENINTQSYESHPYISQDGTYLIFTSDREGGYGETDLYISYRDNSGEWSIAKNLGDIINTPARELAPFIASDGTLYYSSDGYMKNTGLDIIKAERISEEMWGNPIVLTPPINSTFNELGPAMYKNKMIFSSDRKNGCGGYDIYSFDLCNNAVLSGKVGGKNNSNLINDIILYDELDNIIETKKVLSGADYKFELIPNKSYKVVFKSKCNPQDELYEFSVPCSDSNVINYIANFEIKSNALTFNLEDYQIPFFVSGYYRPNTSEHLESLKMKFLQNFFGNSDSTRYIENPGNQYDQYSNQVELALDKAVGFILERLENFGNECINTNAKVQIDIRGFADPRAISDFAKYSDVSISDDRLMFNVNRGDKMDNILLSKLRAYFTFVLLEEKLKENNIYNQNLNKIKWKIIGEGEDTKSNANDLQKRRVSIDISLKERE